MQARTSFKLSQYTELLGTTPFGRGRGGEVTNKVAFHIFKSAIHISCLSAQEYGWAGSSNLFLYWTHKYLKSFLNQATLLTLEECLHSFLQVIPSPLQPKQAMFLHTSKERTATISKIHFCELGIQIMMR
jgi:hypothetical protein